MNNREFDMAAALVAPPTARRSISAGSLLMLEMLANPLAQLDAASFAEAASYHLAELAWVHEADLDRVRAAACVARENPLGVRQMVLAWVDDKPVNWLEDVREWARGEINRALSCMAVHEKESESKNAHGPCSA